MLLVVCSSIYSRLFTWKFASPAILLAAALTALAIVANSTTPSTQLQAQQTNNAPTFSATSYSFNLAENSDGSSTAVSVGTVSATDTDTGDILVYSLSGDFVGYSCTFNNRDPRPCQLASDNKFTINSLTGAITYKGKGENYEGIDTFNLEVQVTDGKIAVPVTVPVTVSVTNVAETPKFVPHRVVSSVDTYDFALESNADGSTTAIAIGKVRYDDQDDDTLTFAITGTGTNKFDISSTGDITYKGSGEASGTFALTVTVKDNASDTTADDTATVNVTVATAATDRAALIALYNATGGDSWTNGSKNASTEPWKINDSTSDMDDWYGIVATNGRVTQVHLARNNLNGTLPYQLGNLTNLTTLYIYHHDGPPVGSVTGSIPASLGNLTGLTILRLDGNRLTGEIPPELGNLSNLQELVLSDNRFTGTIPSELGKLSKLTDLSLRADHNYGNTNLYGPIPAEIGNLTKLEYLTLSRQKLTGEIPSSISNLTLLQNLHLSDNRLTGPIPSDISKLTALRVISLANNNLTGAIPSGIGSLTKATQLHLNDNELTGAIPSGIGGMSKLDVMRLYNNRLTGSIPSGIGSLDKLPTLEVFNNRLDGTIASEIGDMDAVTEILLYNNRLTGSIPTTIGNLDKVTDLRLENNRLSGSIPSEIGNMTALEIIQLELNALTGSIPAEIGNLSNLHTLFLHNNRLTGSIPSELGNATSLNLLRLSSNNLSGYLPSSLSKIPYLYWLLVDHNPNLRGRIPLDYKNSLSWLYYLWFNDTGICVSANVSFQSWINTIKGRGQAVGPYCGLMVDVSANPNQIREEDGPTRITITAQLTEFVGIAIRALVELAGSAIQDEDYEIVATAAPITLPAVGTPSGTTYMVIDPVHDHEPEHDEKIEVSVVDVVALNGGAQTSGAIAQSQVIVASSHNLPVQPVSGSDVVQLIQPTATPACTPRIARIEPSIRSVAIDGNENARLHVNAFGRQNIMDNSLADKVSFDWKLEDYQGNLIKHAIEAVDDGDKPDQRVIMLTAPQAAGTYKLTADLGRCECDDGDGEEDGCSAEFQIESLRKRDQPTPEAAPNNPEGEIPDLMNVGNGEQCDVFTPVDGGTHVNHDINVSVKANAGVVPDGEFICIQASDAGTASNRGMTHHRVTLDGRYFDIDGYSSVSERLTDYQLDGPMDVCIPLPPRLASNINDVAMIAKHPSNAKIEASNDPQRVLTVTPTPVTDSFTVLSSGVRLNGNGNMLCAKMSNLSGTVAAAYLGAPSALPTPTPTPKPTPEAPDTGGTAPPANTAALILLILIGIAILSLAATLIIPTKRQA